MTLSLLYRAFCRVLQFIRLIGHSDINLAIEVAMLRHAAGNRCRGVGHDLSPDQPDPDLTWQSTSTLLVLPLVVTVTGPDA